MGLTKQEKLKRSAIHEAGHAAIYLLQGWIFESVDIIPEGRIRGGIRNGEEVMLPGNYSRDMLSDGYEREFRQYSTIILAGYAAENKLLNRKKMSSADKFSQGITEGSDFNRYLHFANIFFVSNELAWAYFDYIMSELKHLLDNRFGLWESVIAIADELICKQELMKDECETIYKLKTESAL